MAFRNVDVAIGRIGEHVVGLGQRFRRITLHARLADDQQHLAFGTELVDGAALRRLAGELLHFLRTRQASIRHEDIALRIDMDAVRPHEEPTTE